MFFKLKRWFAECQLKKFLLENNEMRTFSITKHVPWIDYKVISASAAALGVTERKAANIPTDAFVIAEAMNNVELRIKASGAEGVGGIAHVYAARKNDDICHLGDISITAGSQLASDNKRYVDTMVLTDRWITEVKLADANANNGMSRLAFDASGYDIVFVLITYTDLTNWVVGISGF